jgi:hypothetical protein
VTAAESSGASSDESNPEPDSRNTTNNPDSKLKCSVLSPGKKKAKKKNKQVYIAQGKNRCPFQTNNGD